MNLRAVRSGHRLTSPFQGKKAPPERIGWWIKPLLQAIQTKSSWRSLGDGSNANSETEA